MFQIGKTIWNLHKKYVKQQTLFTKISKVMPEIEWSTHAPYIYELINKKEKNAVIHHNYKHQKYHGIADFSADSLTLAVEASKTSADIIVMAGVHFVARLQINI